MNNDLITNINKPRKRRYSGFTIVELLIVIVIIGILAAITIVSYTGITAKANIATIQSDLSNASKKLAMYYAEYNTYPTSIDTTTGCPTAPTADTNYCIKSSADTKLIYNYKTTSTYELDATKGSVVYEVTNGGTPTVSPNWMVIGTQTWAKTNLNVGTMITGVTAQTNNSITEKYCYGDTLTNCTAYGALYQWDEVMQYSNNERAQGACPTGSHIPTDSELNILEMSLSGMTQDTANLTDWRGTDEGVKLKNGGASGLNILLAGYRTEAGSFDVLSSSAYLWSSSESNVSTSWRRKLGLDNNTINRSPSKKVYGFSVRCLGN